MVPLLRVRNLDLLRVFVKNLLNFILAGCKNAKCDSILKIPSLCRSAPNNCPYSPFGINRSNKFVRNIHVIVVFMKYHKTCIHRGLHRLVLTPSGASTAISSTSPRFITFSQLSHQQTSPDYVAFLQPLRNSLKTR
jgi:hypothetical protein